MMKTPDESLAVPSATAETPILRVENACRIFRMGDVDVRALIDAELAVAQGEFIIILGPSGSGKSTLLNVIGGMDRASSGTIWYKDRQLSVMTDSELTNYRRDEVGFVFQFYNLIPTLTAYENVQVATELTASPMDPIEALEIVGLADRADHFPAQLSGGEQQRVSIARALAKRPRVLLADEPTGALDLPTARTVLALLQRLNRDQQLTIILITHNPAIAEIANRVVRIVSGRITEYLTNERPIDAKDVSW